MSGQKETLLIVDDDQEFLRVLESALEKEFTVILTSTAEEAKHNLGKGIGLILLDVRLKEEDDTANKDGVRLLEFIRQTRPEIPVVMMTAYGDIDVAVEAMKLGAADFIQKARADVREFRKALRNALERSRLERKVAELEEDLRRLEPWELVGDAPKIHEVRNLVDIVAQDGYCTVLVRGETGTGKELVARAIHSRGWRKDAPFVAVSLPALPRELAEAELFGHTRGAFTDAREARVGYIEKAQGGVLFLDEIGELAPEIQVKLLRVLETKTFALVGSTQEITVDVQVVTATNRDLEQAIKQGKFREDLYFRLKTIEIPLPPLRQRIEDIALLTDHFLFLFRQQGRTKLAGISPDALMHLAAYSFPGNARELKAIVERATMIASSNRHSLIEMSDLQLKVQQPSGLLPQPTLMQLSERGIDLGEELARTELDYIQQALCLTEGKKTEAWRLLGLNDRFALRRRVKRIGEAYPDLINIFPLVSRLYYDDTK
jgi:DNA-binding NtrC family response regulator